MLTHIALIVKYSRIQSYIYYLLQYLSIKNQILIFQLNEPNLSVLINIYILVDQNNNLVYISYELMQYFIPSTPDIYHYLQLPSRPPPPQTGSWPDAAVLGPRTPPWPRDCWVAQSADSAEWVPWRQHSAADSVRAALPWTWYYWPAGWTLEQDASLRQAVALPVAPAPASCTLLIASVCISSTSEAESNC